MKSQMRARHAESCSRSGGTPEHTGHDALTRARSPTALLCNYAMQLAVVRWHTACEPQPA
jgi:hypothetical protein